MFLFFSSLPKKFYQLNILFFPIKIMCNQKRVSEVPYIHA